MLIATGPLLGGISTAHAGIEASDCDGEVVNGCKMLHNPLMWNLRETVRMHHTAFKLMSPPSDVKYNLEINYPFIKLLLCFSLNWRNILKSEYSDTCSL